VATGWLSARAFSFVVGILVAALTAVTPADAQVRRPRADVTPTVFTDAPRAGEVLELGVRVRLDRTLHVQSNTPRAPSPPPTVPTTDAPPGRTPRAPRRPPRPS